MPLPHIGPRQQIIGVGGKCGVIIGHASLNAPCLAMGKPVIGQRQRGLRVFKRIQHIKRRLIIAGIGQLAHII